MFDLNNCLVNGEDIILEVFEAKLVVFIYKYFEKIPLFVYTTTSGVDVVKFWVQLFPRVIFFIPFEIFNVILQSFPSTLIAVIVIFELSLFLK